MGLLSQLHHLLRSHLWLQLLHLFLLGLWLQYRQYYLLGLVDLSLQLLQCLLRLYYQNCLVGLLSQLLLMVLERQWLQLSPWHLSYQLLQCYQSHQYCWPYQALLWGPYVHFRLDLWRRLCRFHPILWGLARQWDQRRPLHQSRLWDLCFQCFQKRLWHLSCQSLQYCQLNRCSH